MKVLKSILAFVGSNSATIIALSSMVIAGCSLALTYYSQRRDEMYKEVSIQPILGMHADVDNFTFKLQNVGMGPALINRVTFGLDGKCYDSDDKNQEVFSAAAINFQVKTGDDIYKKTLPESTKTNKALNISATSSPIKPPLVVRAGEDYTLFKIQPDTLNELRRLPPNILAEAKNRFATAVSMVPLSLMFCSATSQYCEIGQTENDECVLVKQ